jgi:response regulator of citrate/malate metabolism
MKSKMMNKFDSRDDQINFLDDVLTHQEKDVQPWRILVVDDDGEVHQATRFALSDIEIMDRPLSLIHAYSGAEAEVLLRQMPDIAVVLLDVVMESDDSGLCLIDLVRDDLINKPLRVILRTGQPGLAPEAALVARYDIHDYMLKTDVSRERLVTSLTTAVRTFDQLKQMALVKQQMQGMVQAVSGALVATTPKDFSEWVIQQLNSLYHLSPMIAVWHKKDTVLSSAVVHVADATHADWQGQQLADLSDDPLVSYVAKILSAANGESFSDAIVFDGVDWRLVLVFHEDKVAQDLVAESFQMFQSLMVSCANRCLVN